MYITGFLAYVGLIIAAYSLLSKHDKLRIQIRLSVLDKVVSIFLLVIIFLALILSDYFRDYEKVVTFSNILFKMHFIITASAYIALFLLSLYIFFKIRKKKLKRRKLFLFKNLIEDLLNKKEYSTIVELVRPEAVRIIKYSKRVSFLNSIKDNLLRFFKTKPDFKIPPEAIERVKKLIEAGEIEIDLEENEHIKKSIKSFLNKLSGSFRHYVGKFIRIFVHESRDKYQNKAQDLLNLLLSNHEFIARLVEFRPELGLKIFEQEFYDYHDYAAIYFYELMKNTGSILYYEIRNNQNIDTNHRYSLKKENKLLIFLFKDIKVAQRLEVSRGVANLINENLDDLNKQENDPYNYAYENFKEVRWNSPIFVGIRFFDIMISETMHQGLEWQYPIIYFRILTEKILKNFKAIPQVWKEPHEWNSKYAYLLYEIVSTLESLVFWIKYSEFSYPIELKSDDHDLEGGNVIKSSIIYLIEILDLIAASENVPDKFKRYLADIVLILLFELRTSSHEESIRYSNVILNCIKDCMVKYRKFNRSFYNLIRTSYDKFDKIHYTASASERSNLASKLDTEIEEYLTTILETNS
jgi:hypothetical protein